MRTFVLFAFLLFLGSCNAPTSNQDSNEIAGDSATTMTEESTTATDENPSEEDADEAEPSADGKFDYLEGHYVGNFVASKMDAKQNYSYMNKINISVEAINDDGTITGRSVVAGNDRPFLGTYKVKDLALEVEAKEPGDDRYDGVFYFDIFTEINEISGIWKANDTGLAVPEREYTSLEKMDFKYDPNLELPEYISWAQLYNGEHPEEFVDWAEAVSEDVLRYNVSKVKLTSTQVENMFKGDLEVLRNSIYARHGYTFKNRKMRYLFDGLVDWYIPYSTDIRDELTEVELHNIELLKRYEDHAEKYYDSFGR